MMIKEQFELPSCEDARSRVLNGTDTVIDWFIAENEPRGIVEQAKFRREVTDLIVFAAKSAKTECERDWDARFKRENEMHRQELNRLNGKTKDREMPPIMWLLISILAFFTIASIVDFFGR